MRGLSSLQQLLVDNLSELSADFLSVWRVTKSVWSELVFAGTPPTGLEDPIRRCAKISGLSRELDIPQKQGLSLLDLQTAGDAGLVLLVWRNRSPMFARRIPDTALLKLQLAALGHVHEYVLGEVALASNSTTALLTGFKQNGNPFQVTLDYLLNSFCLEHGSIWGLHDNSKFLGPRYLTLEAVSRGKHEDYTQNCLPEPEGLVWRALAPNSPKIQEIRNVQPADLANRHLHNLYQQRFVYLIRLGEGSAPFGVACLAGKSAVNLAVNTELLSLFEGIVALEWSSNRHELADSLISKIHDLFHQEEVSVEDLCSRMCSRLREIVNCEATSIFLKPALDVTADDLTLTASQIDSTATESESLARFRAGNSITYKVTEDSLTGSVAKLRKPLIENQVSKSFRNSRIFREVADSSRDTWIGVPMLTTRNDCIGVIRCAGKQASNNGQNYIFSSIDYRALTYAANILVPLVQLAMASQDANKNNIRLAERERIREHEMRGPLQLVTSNAEFVKKHLYDQGVTSKSRRLESIIANTHLCGSLLTSTQLPTDTLFLKQLQPVKLHPLLLIIADVLKQQIVSQSPSEIDLDEESLEFRVTPRPFMAVELRGQSPTVIGHRDLLQRAFYNLGNNAVKYADRQQLGRLIITARNHITDPTVIITFEDRGIGVPQEEKELIFKDGYRGTTIGNRQGQGIGLGIARAIVEKHRGTLKITQLKEPTIFEVILPNKPDFRRNP